MFLKGLVQIMEKVHFKDFFLNLKLADVHQAVAHQPGMHFRDGVPKPFFLFI